MFETCENLFSVVIFISKDKFLLEPPRLDIFGKIFSSECPTFGYLILKSFSSYCEVISKD